MENKYLIKRSSKIIDGAEFSYELNNGWYAEVNVRGKPKFSDALKNDDLIYVAESGYAIFGFGKVDERISETFDSLNAFTSYVLSKAKTQHERYWFGKLKHVYEKYDGKSKIGILEFKLKESETYDIPYILGEDYKKRNISWYKLEDDFSIQKVPLLNTQLHPYIPTSLRKALFHKYKLLSSSHLIDIDHHVPKSLNGPGNIEENLVPLSVFQNRAKSNSVPSRLFFHAERFNIEISKDTSIKPENYLTSSKHLSVAKLIIEEINKDFDLAKQIYLDIKLFHFPHCL